MAAMEKNNKNLNVPNLRFPEFSGEWDNVSLGDISDITKLAGFEFTQYVQYEDSGNIIALRGLNCKNGSLDLTDVKYIDNSILEKLTRSKLYVGDILFTYVGTVGEVAIIEENDRFYLAPNVSRIRVEQGYNPYFIKQLIHTKRFYNKIIFPLIATSSQPALSMENVRKFSLSIPQESEQGKLAEFLNILDQRISTQKKIIEKYESLIRGLYQLLFQNAKYNDFASLGDISQISNGNSDVKDASMYNDGSLYPFFDRSDEIKFLPEYLFDKEAIIYPGEGAEFYPRYYNGKFALHQRCYAVYDISTDYIPRYLYHYCKTQNSYFVRNAVGSTVASLRLDTFKRLKIPAIPTHHQESLVMFLDKIEAKIECNRTILKKYEEQKKHLLSNLFI